MAAVVGLAVEVKIGLGGEAVEGALVPDFDAVQQKRVVAQFDVEGAQREVDFVKGFAEGVRKVGPQAKSTIQRSLGAGASKAF